MKKPSTLLFTLLASLSLTGGPLWAQSSDKAAKKPKIEAAPNVKNFKALQKLNQQIVDLSKKAQPATVCLVAKNGRGAGSGVVVSEDGLILTAAHVTSSMPEDVIVIFPDGTRKEGVSLGADYDRDAAMVQIKEPGKYPFVEAGKSKNLKRNQWTVALGHSGGFDPMRKPPVRLGRVLTNERFIVTDTAVVGGDSGGPLFDAQGRVIGIHSNIGVSLMENRHVPIDVYHQQWESLKEGKKSGEQFNNAPKDLPSPDQPVLGVQLEDSDDGVRVIAVVPKSPAERAGIQANDVIKKINGTVIKSTEELIALVKKMKAGDEVRLNYHRDGDPWSVKVKLTSYKKLAGEGKAPAKKNDPKKDEQKEKATQKKASKKTSEDELNKLIDGLMKDGGSVRKLELTPGQLEKFGGMEELTKRIKERMGAAPPKSDKEEKKKDAAPKKEEPKKNKPESKEDPAPKKKEPKKKKAGDVIDELMKKAAKNAGRLEVTPELIEKMGGMEKLMEELEKRGGMTRRPNQGPDKFFESSLKALEPVSKKNEGRTALVLIDDKTAALGTVISANGRILTKNTETLKGKLSVRLGDRKYEAKVVRRFPERDLALLKIEAEGLQPVRFQAEEPPLGSILTATGAKDEPLGIGLLSVPGRAMAKVGFIGIQAAESDKGVLIQKVVPKGAASEAGLKDNDVVTHIDGKKVDDHVEFGHLIRGRKAGEEVKVQYLRDGKAGKATATLKERAMRDNIKNDPRMKASLGMLSEKTSGYPDAIQHDIPLPPQLCGGPLFDLKGRCIGINVSRAGRTKTYAIPADEIQAMLKVKKGPRKPAQAKKPAAKNDTNDKSEAIKAIRQSLQEIEKRLEELEKAER